MKKSGLKEKSQLKWFWFSEVQIPVNPNLNILEYHENANTIYQREKDYSK